MKKHLKNILCLGLLLSLSMSNQLKAQEEASNNSSRVILVLKNGTQIAGDVVDWEYQKKITVMTDWGKKMTFEDGDVKKILQESTINFSPEAIYNFEETGKYISLKTMFITGNDGARARAVNGFGFSASVGYRFNRWLGLGVGAAYDQFIWNSGEEIIPIFAEISGFTNPSNVSGFYNLQAGYGLALTSEEFLMTDAQGGWMVYPSAGIRFGNKANKFTLDLGYKFQKASFTYQDQWTSTTLSEQRVIFKRLTLRFGILI